MSEDGTQQGDSEAPLLFAETKTDACKKKKLESKINVGYLDGRRNLANDYKIVLRDLKKTEIRKRPWLKP